MPRQKKPDALLTSLFPETLVPVRALLTSFLTYFPTNPSSYSSGRHVLCDYGVLYWPDFLPACRRSTTWFPGFWPPSEQRSARQRAGVPRQGPAFQSWWNKALRRRVTALLGNLVLPTTSPSAAGYIYYAHAQPGFHPPTEAMSDTIRVAMKDPTNYLFFRRVAPKDIALSRLLLPPPPYEIFSPVEQMVPMEITALYYAWMTLHYRAPAAEPSSSWDPAEVGLEWTDQGFIFVNWARFLRSPKAPPIHHQSPVSLDLLPYEVAERLKGGPSKGRYNLKVSAFPSTDVFKHFVASSTIAAFTPTGEFADPCSLIDPLYLYSRPDLFRSEFHQEREKNQRRQRVRQEAQMRRHASAFGEAKKDNAIHNTRKVYLFRYTPWDHIPYDYKCYAKPCVIPPDVEELAYAVSHRGQLHFRPPTLRPITRDSPPGEVAAWQAMLATYRFYDQVAEAGEIGEVAMRAYADITKALVNEELTKQAEKTIKNFVSLDLLSKAELKRLRRARAKAFGEDPDSAEPASRWYIKLIIEKAKRVKRNIDVFHRATVVIPEVSSTPMETRFFSQHALKTLLPLAKDEAPYLYAWATVCLKAAIKGPAFSDVPLDERARWTPQEDHLLIQGYRRLGMKANAKDDLVHALGGRHDWEAIKRRARWINTTLASVLHSRQMAKYTVGKLWFADKPPLTRPREIMRILFVLGVASYRQSLGEELTLNMPSITQIFVLHPVKLDFLHLPNRYRVEDFEKQIKAAMY